MHRLHEFLILLGIAAVSCTPLSYSGGESFDDPKEVNAAHQGERVLVHMKSGLKPDDAQPCVAFNMVLGFVRSGYEVDVLIDAAATSDFLGDSSKWAKYKLPIPMVQAVAAELGMRPDEFPETYMGYLEWLSEQGVEVHMNATMNILNGYASTIRNQTGVPEFMTLVTFPEMAALIADADVYMAY